MSMRKLVVGGLVAALASMTGVGVASAKDGWYVAGGGTIAFLNDVDQAVQNAPVPGVTALTTSEGDVSGGAFVAAGRSFSRFRVEAEVGYTENDADKLRSRAPIQITVPLKGETNIWRYMINGYVDFRDADAKFRPYLGAGVGLAEIDYLRVHPRPAFPTEAPRRLLDDSSSSTAWQLMAGASYSLTPRWSVTAQYRWFDAGEPDAKDVRGERATFDVAGGHIDLGARLAF